MASKGLFITVEGGEGAGKSTNMAYLQSRLSTLGVDVLVTREPGGTPLGEEIRQLLLQPREDAMTPAAELLLIFAARAQHLAQVIEPALAAGRWVLCDRFTDATYAYQGGGRQLPLQMIETLEQLVQQERRPDYTILLDTPVEVGMARAENRGARDRIEQEQLDFFQRVRATYLGLAEDNPRRYRRVDATQDLPGVQAQLDKICDELMAGEGRA